MTTDIRLSLDGALRAYSASALAREAGISTRTVFRLRRGSNDPTLQTAERLIAAAKRLSKRAK
jgi:predicted transcriptional regulator